MMAERSKNSKWRWLRKLFARKKPLNTRCDSRIGAEVNVNSTYDISNCKSFSVKGNVSVLKVVAICGSLRKASYNRGLIRAAIEIAKESIPGMEIELLDISELPFLNTDLEVDGRFPEAVEAFRKRFWLPNSLSMMVLGSKYFGDQARRAALSRFLSFSAMTGINVWVGFMVKGFIKEPQAQSAVATEFALVLSSSSFCVAPALGYWKGGPTSTSAWESGPQHVGPLKNAIDWASRSPNVMAGKPAAIMSVAGSLGGARAQYHLRQIGVYLDLHFINKPELFVSGSQPPKKFDEDGNLIDKATRDCVKRLLLALQAFAIKLLN
eukprot:Gb_30140 [translate_table: standard]